MNKEKAPSAAGPCIAASLRVGRAAASARPQALPGLALATAESEIYKTDRGGYRLEARCARRGMLSAQYFAVSGFRFKIDICNIMFAGPLSICQMRLP